MFALLGTDPLGVCTLLKKLTLTNWLLRSHLLQTMHKQSVCQLMRLVEAEWTSQNQIESLVSEPLCSDHTPGKFHSCATKCLTKVPRGIRIINENKRPPGWQPDPEAMKVECRFEHQKGSIDLLEPIQVDRIEERDQLG